MAQFIGFLPLEASLWLLGLLLLEGPGSAVLFRAALAILRSTEGKILSSEECNPIAMASHVTCDQLKQVLAFLNLNLLIQLNQCMQELEAECPDELVALLRKKHRSVVIREMMTNNRVNPQSCEYIPPTPSPSLASPSLPDISETVRSEIDIDITLAAAAAAAAAAGDSSKVIEFLKAERKEKAAAQANTTNASPSTEPLPIAQVPKQPQVTHVHSRSYSVVYGSYPGVRGAEELYDEDSLSEASSGSERQGKSLLLLRDTIKPVSSTARRSRQVGITPDASARPWQPSGKRRDKLRVKSMSFAKKLNRMSTRGGGAALDAIYSFMREKPQGENEEEEEEDTESDSATGSETETETESESEPLYDDKSSGDKESASQDTDEGDRLRKEKVKHRRRRKLRNALKKIKYGDLAVEADARTHKLSRESTGELSASSPPTPEPVKKPPKRGDESEPLASSAENVQLKNQWDWRMAIKERYNQKRRSRRVSPRSGSSSQVQYLQQYLLPQEHAGQQRKSQIRFSDNLPEQMERRRLERSESMKGKKVAHSFGASPPARRKREMMSKLKPAVAVSEE
jgi:hypothetical protein